jgi:hypothetical protein
MQWVFWQWCDRQSPSSPHGLPGGQVGAQLGGAHLLATQLCDAQSASAPQGVPPLHPIGLHAHPGGRHDPF